LCFFEPITQVDGTDIQEFPIDVLSVSVAQRYSILVTARNDTKANWAIHANMNTAMFDIVPNTTIASVYCFIATCASSLS
jgi:iron transport multicopper oxidase